MGTLWVPGAERLKPSAAGGTITSTAPPRVVWHTTEAPSGSFNSMVRVLTNKSAEPQILWDPVTDRLGQFFPLNQSGRALKNDGATRTNRVGRVCIQIEVIAYSSKPFTDYWKPGPNFRNLMAAIQSWGIGDVWPSGPPPKFVAVGTGGYNSPEDERSRAIWTTKGGHYGHSQIPGNDHGDPGGISTAALFAAGKASSGNTPAPTGDDSMSAQDVAELKAYIHSEVFAGPRYQALQNSVNAVGAAVAAILPYLKSEDAADDSALNKAVADLKAAIAAPPVAP